MSALDTCPKACFLGFGPDHDDQKLICANGGKPAGCYGMFCVSLLLFVYYNFPGLSMESHRRTFTGDGGGPFLYGGSDSSLQVGVFAYFLAYFSQCEFIGSAGATRVSTYYDWIQEQICVNSGER
jgi:hypothetical protein